MTEDEARVIATRAIGRWGTDGSYTVTDAEMKVIEVQPGAPVDQRPGGFAPQRDVLVWEVRLSDGRMRADIAIDDANGDIVRVLKSR